MNSPTLSTASEPLESLLTADLRTEETSFRNFIWKWMGISLILHLVTAYFSVGYHSADEQFQILEFLAYKLGLAPRSDLAVEFGEKMRPWLQPAIYYGMTRFWQVLGIFNPFTWALSFRLFAAGIGWLSSLALAFSSGIWFGPDHPRLRRFAVLALALIWYFPAIHARPSSESLGGSAFFLGIGLFTLTLNQESYHRPTLWTGRLLRLCVGACLGLSFESRFQMGLMIFGFASWILFRPDRVTRKLQARIVDLCWIGTGFVLIFALGRWVDHWAYGDWSFSPKNYFAYNLIRGEVSRYGRAPWWDLFRMAFTESWPFIGLFVALTTILAWIRRTSHILTWSVVPFFLVHEAIAHKELRFFFPIALAGPIFLAMALAPMDLPQKLRDWAAKLPRLTSAIQLLGKGFWRFLLLNNFIALIALLFLPFSRTVQFYQGVYEAFERERHQIPAQQASYDLFVQQRDPYEILGTPIYFYRPAELRIKSFADFHQLADATRRRETDFWLFSPRFELNAEALALLPRCERVFQTLPSWVKRINFAHWLDRANAWSLYRCKSPSSSPLSLL